MNIAEILEARSRATPDRIALVERRVRWSYRELEEAVAAGAAALRRQGIGAGDRVLLFCPVSIRLYVALLALFRVGAAAVIVDPGAGPALLDRCVARLGPTGFLGVPTAHVLRLVRPALRRVRPAIVLGGRWPHANAASGADRAIRPCAPDTPALVTFTSGTTGEPKAAVRSHGFLLAQHAALAAALELRGGQIDLATLPILILANLASGVTSVIADADLRAPGSVDGAKVCEQIARERPNRVVASPAFLDRVVRQAFERRVRLDSLADVYVGGAPVTSRALDAARAAAPRARATAVYGSTEAEPIAQVSLDDIGVSDRERMVSGGGLLAGRTVAPLDLRILPDRWGRPIGPFAEDAFARDALAAGEAGEIVVAGPHVLGGYLDGIGDAQTKFTVGARVWHRTGDAGYVDHAGRLWLLGRAAARVSDDSGTQYPLAVEAAALAVPWVRRAGLVAADGRRTLAIEVGPDAPRGATDDLRSRLSWARLDRVCALRALPVDARHNAKIDYLRLGRACRVGSR